MWKEVVAWQPHGIAIPVPQTGCYYITYNKTNTPVEKSGRATLLLAYCIEVYAITTYDVTIGVHDRPG